MACYSNACKSLCAKVVVGLSVIIVLLGLVSCIFGGMQMGNKITPSEVIPEFSDTSAFDGSGFGLFVLIFGLITIITGVLGILTAKYKKPWFATLFILLTFVMGMALFIAGILAAFGGAIYDLVAESACNSNPGYQYYRELVDRKFCTDQCKCDEAYKDPWEAKRDDPTFKGQLERAGRNFDDLKFTSDGIALNTWEQCYEAFIKNEIQPGSTQEKFLNMGGVQFVRELE
jgi:hypothetical protein